MHGTARAYGVSIRAPMRAAAATAGHFAGMRQIHQGNDEQRFPAIDDQTGFARTPAAIRLQPRMASVAGMLKPAFFASTLPCAP